MLSLISPSKTLTIEKHTLLTPVSQPVLLSETNKLAAVLKKKSPAALKKLMEISDKLAELNHARYQAFDPKFSDKNAVQAIRAFQGDVYGGLDATTLTLKQLEKLNKQLLILSGFYGILKPFDLMQPYRLEMGIKLITPKRKDLYTFWGNQITEVINAELEAQNHSHVLNLASNEYFKAVKPKLLTKPLVTIDFKEKKANGYQTVGLFAKRARGLFVRFMVTESPKHIEDLKSFALENYRFNSTLSSGTTLVFTR